MVPNGPMAPRRRVLGKAPPFKRVLLARYLLLALHQRALTVIELTFCFTDPVDPVDPIGYTGASSFPTGETLNYKARSHETLLAALADCIEGPIQATNSTTRSNVEKVGRLQSLVRAQSCKVVASLEISAWSVGHMGDAHTKCHSSVDDRCLPMMRGI
ncbi:hypothetical protein BT67DRAFT_135539 [Trichocladium antarcticum]|uniref:Uncharacterized protein n=1 Tax=Trichocladium antarcticum TaxID=1450529 RepID=A0AAN6UFL5_9PEZI|nr:hypothetical protein BT67DRAFT_135539 [Trichocladium antarcticum]